MGWCIGLGRAVISRKACFNSSDSPLFNEDLAATIFLNPSNVICCLFLTKQQIFLNNSKSISFCVKSGYLSKWSIIAFKSF